MRDQHLKPTLKIYTYCDRFGAELNGSACAFFWPRIAFTYNSCIGMFLVCFRQGRESIEKGDWWETRGLVEKVPIFEQIFPRLVD